MNGQSAMAEEVQEGHGQKGIFVIRGTKKGQLNGHIKRQKELNAVVQWFLLLSNMSYQSHPG